MVANILYSEFSPQLDFLRQKHEEINKIKKSASNKHSKRRRSVRYNKFSMEIFPAELKNQNDFDHFVKNTFAEMKRRENLNPFEVCKISKSKRQAKHVITLSNWLKSVEFFSQFPDLIMDRV